MKDRYKLPPLGPEEQVVLDNLRACGNPAMAEYDPERNIEGMRGLGLADTEIASAIPDANTESISSPSTLNRRQQRLLGRAAWSASEFLRTVGALNGAADHMRRPQDGLGGDSILSAMSTDSRRAMREAVIIEAALFNKKAAEAGY